LVFCWLLVDRSLARITTFRTAISSFASCASLRYVGLCLSGTADRLSRRHLHTARYVSLSLGDGGYLAHHLTNETTLFRSIWRNWFSGARADASSKASAMVLLQAEASLLTHDLLGEDRHPHLPAIEFVIVAVTPIAGRGGEGDRRAPRPGRSGCHRGPGSTFRSSPRARLRAPG
jgi:hypothetical protein